LKARWLKFLKAHEAELRADKQFEPGDPALSPDLFPQCRFYLDDKTWWPPGATP
jgi:hypothetical protein